MQIQKFGKGIGKPYDTDAMLSRDEFSGENLFYGIRLSDIICAIPDDDKLPRRVAEPRA